MPAFTIFVFSRVLHENKAPTRQHLPKFSVVPIAASRRTATNPFSALATISTLGTYVSARPGTSSFTINATREYLGIMKLIFHLFLYILTVNNIATPGYRGTDFSIFSSTQSPSAI